jgi:class 3 adenylate cyclase/tetratricopeptide (TPR) repeat protein
MRCARCGTENEDDSRFCDECGSPLGATCPTCAAPVRAGARFCRSCGSGLTATTAAPGDAPARQSERRLVTVLFADLVGFTTLAEDRDPESTRELLSRYFDVARDAIERHGGTIEKFIGDAVMAVWGTPVAREDDAERAVRAALELVDAIPPIHPDLQARAAVLTGEAAVTLDARDQGMVAGDLVNTAARLQGVADPGTVLAGESTVRAAERSVVFERLGDQSLKGKTSPVPAWRAIRVVAQRGGQGRSDGLEPPFVGRDEELRQLKEALHATGRERRTRLVSITGPAGIGKSRLVWELEKYVDGISERIRWHRGRSPSYGDGIAFWALGEMVRRRAGLTEDDDEPTTRARIAATLDEFVADASERERIGPALLSLLGLEPAPVGGRDALFPAWRAFFERVAETGTTVLVFEDLHWADAGLLAFLNHLLDWSRGLPILVVTVARPEVFDRHPDWGRGHRQLTAMALEPLDAAAMRTLLAGLVPGLPDQAAAAIVGRAEGVPLYAVEMVRSLLADGRLVRDGEIYTPTGDLGAISVPETLRSLIASRLDALDPADRSLLQDAAVLGQVFGTDALAAVSGIPAESLTERLTALARRELLDVERDPASPERGQHKFVQSLMREVAYGTLARRDRRERHLAVARHFEATGDAELAGALASHYVAAHAASDEGPEADALAARAREALSAAADRALALGSPDQAMALLDQELILTQDPRERIAILDRAARAGGLAGRPEAGSYAAAAAEAARELGDPALHARALARLGFTYIDVGQTKLAEEVLAEALGLAETAGAPAVAAEIQAYRSRVFMRLNRDAEAIVAADAALPTAEALDLEDIVTEALINKGVSIGIVGRPREALALLRTAVDRADQGGAAGVALRARNNYALMLADADPRHAEDLLRETLAIAGEVGDRGHYNWLLGSVCMASLGSGTGWDEHAARIEEAMPTAFTRIDRVRMRSMLGFYQGTRGEALDTLVPELTALAGPDPDPGEQYFIAYHGAEAALERGDTADAVRLALEAHALDTAWEHALRLALRAASLGRDLAAVREVAAVANVNPAGGALSRALRTQLAAAESALDGRPDEARAGFRAARAEYLRMSQDVSAALLVVDALVLLPAEPEVRSWADAARTALEAVGARPALARLDAALATGPELAPVAIE